MSNNPAGAGRVTMLTTYTAVSIAVAALALTGHESIAVTIAVPIYSWLQANMHRRVRNLQQSIGPANGSNVHQLLSRLVALEKYTHQRNHDILGALTPSNAHIANELTELKTLAGTLLERVPPSPTEGTDQQ